MFEKFDILEMSITCEYFSLSSRSVIKSADSAKNYITSMAHQIETQNLNSYFYIFIYNASKTNKTTS